MNAQDIQAKYGKHPLLKGKNRGDATELSGKTVVIVFLVDDKTSKWNDAVRDKFMKTHDSAMETLLKVAKKYPISLTIQTVFEEMALPIDCTGDNTKVWIDQILQRYNRKFFGGFKKHYKESCGYDQVAVAFVFNKPFRAYASPERSMHEYSVIHSNNNTGTIVHELLHQFGAADLYYPKEVKDIVLRRYYPTVMHSGSAKDIDPLTAYLIGWSDEIDDKTAQLLEDTKHLTFVKVLTARSKS